jgi:hypothetical protein
VKYGASLRTRLARIERETELREAAALQHASAKLVTSLPSVSNWQDFAPLTWIQTGDDDGASVEQFNPYQFQKDFIQILHRARRVQVLKSRQIGISEVICNYLANRALTEPGFTAVIISKTQKDSQELAKRVRFMVESIKNEPLTWLSNSDTRLSWKGRGTLHFLPSTSRGARGIPACSVLFLDEAAFIDGVAGIYQGANPSLMKLGKAGKVIVVSTPDLETDWYGQLWTTGLPSDWYDFVERRDFVGLQAMLDEVGKADSWARVALHYSMHPQYGADPHWAENYRKQEKYTQSQWNAEFELKFGSTASAIYPSILVKSCAKGTFAECGMANRIYSMGVDPNGGGDDYFTAMVLDITSKPNSVAAMYRQNNRSSPYSLAKVKDLIENFLPSKVIVEKNSMGIVIAEGLALQSAGTEIELVYMSDVIKNAITDRTLYMMEDEDLIFPDGIIADEHRAFRRDDKGKRSAGGSAHDDTVMALALAAMAAPGSVDLMAFLKAA